jgi:hypothetical protein
MTLVITNSIGARLKYEGVELVLIDTKSLRIMQPKLNRKSGCRVTELPIKTEESQLLKVEVNDLTQREVDT